MGKDADYIELGEEMIKLYSAIDWVRSMYRFGGDGAKNLKETCVQ